MNKKQQNQKTYKEYYQANLEKERARNRDKYHRLKNKWKESLTEEQKMIKFYLNRETQRKWYNKNKLKPILSNKNKETIRTLEEVIKVLKKDLKSRLWYSSFLFWNDKDWQDFIKLEKQ